MSGGNGSEDTPVPIPNTAVKPAYAEDTWPETARENRELPDSSFLLSSLAQLVEHAAVNRRVVRSSRTGGAKTSFVYYAGDVFLCCQDIRVDMCRDIWVDIWVDIF